jgi:hypothetical protein
MHDDVKPCQLGPPHEQNRLAKPAQGVCVVFFYKCLCSFPKFNVHNIWFYSSWCYVDHPRYVRGLYRLFLKKNGHAAHKEGKEGRWLHRRHSDGGARSIAGLITYKMRSEGGSEGYRGCTTRAQDRRATATAVSHITVDANLAIYRLMN